MRKWLTGILLVVLLGLAVPIAVLWYIIATSDDTTTALHAKGYPTTIEELEAWYPEPPHGENAAELYAEADALLSQSDYLSDYHKARVLPDGGMSADMRAGIALFLEREASAFEFIDEAARLKESRYRTVYDWRLPSRKPPFDARYGQQLRVLYYAATGDAEAALDQWATLVHLTRSLAVEPPPSLARFENAVRNTVWTVEQIVTMNDLSTEELARIDRLLEELVFEDALLRELVAMRCLTLAEMDSTVWFPLQKAYERTVFINAIDECITLAEDGLPVRLDEFRALFYRDYSSIQMYSEKYASAPVAAFVHFYEVQAHVSTARIAIAIQKHRAAGHELPDRIDGFPDEVVATWPIDPFSGRPMQYKRKGDGFIVYSVGINYQDDGGQREQDLYTVFRVLE